MSEEQKEYKYNFDNNNLYLKYPDIVQAFNPLEHGSIFDGSFNGTIYKSFCGKFTYKQSNNDWVICETSNTPPKNIPRFRGAIESNAFAEKLLRFLR